MDDSNSEELTHLVKDLKRKIDSKDEELKFLKFRIRELQEEVSRHKFAQASEHNLVQKQEIVDHSVQLEARINQKIEEMRQEVGSLRTLVAASTDSVGKSISGLEKNQREQKEKDVKVENVISGVKVDLHKQITNIQNVVFANPLLPLFPPANYQYNYQTEVSFKWVLEDYDVKFKLGEQVYSPLFHTKVCGYSFRLCVKWSGRAKENMGLFLHLHRGNTPVTSLLPFKKEYTLGVYDRYGQKKPQRISFASICNSPNSFTIKEGQDEAEGGGYGIPSMLTAPYDS